MRPDGRISTTLVNDERAYGLTVPELTDVLRKDYGNYLKSVILSVVVKAFAPYRVYVCGEVATPSELVTMPPNLTLSQAIARAGGIKLAGKTDEVIILRRGLDDVPQVFKADYSGIANGSKPAHDILLANYDVVYVPKTPIAEFYLFFNQYLQQFVPVSWGFSYLVNSSGNAVVQQRTDNSLKIGGRRTSTVLARSWRWGPTWV